MKKYTKDEYIAEFGKDEEFLFDPEYLGVEKVEVECIYISENDECPYIGYKYSNGQYWIYGARSDQRVSGEDEIKEWLKLS